MKWLWLAELNQDNWSPLAGAGEEGLAFLDTRGCVEWWLSDKIQVMLERGNVLWWGRKERVLGWQRTKCILTHTTKGPTNVHSKKGNRPSHRRSAAGSLEVQIGFFFLHWISRPWSWSLNVRFDFRKIILTAGFYWAANYWCLITMQDRNNCVTTKWVPDWFCCWLDLIAWAPLVMPSL